MAPRVGSSMIIDYPSTTTTTTTNASVASAKSAAATGPMNVSGSTNSAATVAASSNNNNHIRNTLRNTIPSNGNLNGEDIDYANSIHVQNIIASNFKDSSSQHVGSVLRKQVGLLAGKTAKRRLNELRNTSRLPRAKHDFLSGHDEHHDHEDAFFDDLHKPLRLSWDEIFVEDMLGMGGFGSVCLVTCPKLRKQREREQRKAAAALQRGRTSGALHLAPYNQSLEDASMNTSFALTADDSSFGGSMMLSYASTTTAATGGYEKPLDPNKYYACKSLSNKTIKQANVRGFVQAAADLVHEAFLLSHINPHPNLVRLYGIPSGELETAFCGNDDEPGGSDLGYFLVLEALGGGILSDKIGDWKLQNSRMMRERNILRKRREQQLSQKSIPAPPSPSNSPTLGSFLGSPVEQRKSHTGKRAGGRRSSAGSEGMASASAAAAAASTALLDETPGLVWFQNYQIPTIEERLDIALQVACGMQHLHAHGVIFRDLKPHNVGLSVASLTPPPANPGDPQPQQSLTWRLFDFGLAREVPISSRISGSPRTMMGRGGNHGVASDPSVVYGKAGSLRYMAPETMGGRWLRSAKHQNSSCFATFGSDAYAFAVLMWELIGLQNFDKRYETSPEDFESAVCDRGHRPGMEALDVVIDQMDVATEDESEAEATARTQRRMNIRELVHACWREDYRQRPTFDFIVDTLRTMLPKPVEASERDDDDDMVDGNTVATDNLDASGLLDASSAILSMGKQQQQQPYKPRMPIDPLSELRISGHSYKSHSARSGASKRRLKYSNRSISSRSMMSAQSVSTHSMVLEDVFELETEHSHSTGSRSQKKSNHRYDDLDDDDLEDEDDDPDGLNDGFENDAMDLMNESMITVENKAPSSLYLNCNDDDDAENDLDGRRDAAPSSIAKSSKGKKLTRPKSTSSLSVGSSVKRKKKKKNKKTSRSSHC